MRAALASLIIGLCTTFGLAALRSAQTPAEQRGLSLKQSPRSGPVSERASRMQPRNIGVARLSIWVRDTAHPRLPYQSTGDSWTAAILTCDLQPLHFGAVKNGLYRLTDPSRAGGRVHGQVEVPAGCYIVVGFAACQNVFTEMAMVEVRADEEASVNLIAKPLSTCARQLIWALDVAQSQRAIPRQVISNAVEALKRVDQYLPGDPLLSVLPISMDDLKDMARGQREASRRR